ncbi:MAG: hypothetical protein II399_01555 [Lachnospiraceae bacterium]|nr:hypothetical protein [Lachnospiraceae bacterium]
MKYYGKEKCKILKQIRAEIAKNNDIEYVIEECPYQGNCKGTCPKCEQEVKELEAKLEARKKAGKKIILAGVAASMSLSVLGGCVSDDALGVKGKMIVSPESSETAEATEAVRSPETTPGDETEIELQGDIAYVDDIDIEPLAGKPVEPPKETEVPEQLMGKFPAPDYVDSDDSDNN